MPSNSSSTSAFEIKFETAASVPAPYAHFYHVRASFTPDQQLQIQYTLRYLGREELTEEEITGEGFTLSDDYDWQGTLPRVWTEELQRLLSRTSLTNPNYHEEDVYFELVLQQQNGEVREGAPKNSEQWEYTAQELIQAIYEVAGKELPLTIRYKHMQPDKRFTKLTLTVRFGPRLAEITTETGSGPVGKQTKNWQQLQPLLQKIYMPDYHSENGSPKEPNRPGVFIDSGDGLWYEFGVSVHNPSKKRDVLAELQKELDAFGASV